MLVDGTDLRRKIGCTVLEPQHAIGLLSQVAEALDAARAEGLIHRDVKPSNILISPSGHAYLADFGHRPRDLASGDELTEPGAIIGTWDYLWRKPERGVCGGSLGRRAGRPVLPGLRPCSKCLTGSDSVYPGRRRWWGTVGRSSAPAPRPRRPCSCRRSLPAADRGACGLRLAKDPPPVVSPRRRPSCWPRPRRRCSRVFDDQSRRSCAASPSACPPGPRPGPRISARSVRSHFHAGRTELVCPPLIRRPVACSPLPLTPGSAQLRGLTNAAWFHARGATRSSADLLRSGWRQQLGTRRNPWLLGRNVGLLASCSVLRARASSLALHRLTDPAESRRGGHKIIPAPPREPIRSARLAHRPRARLIDTDPAEPRAALSGSRPPASARRGGGRDSRWNLGAISRRRPPSTRGA